jgi:hypothetical protein
VESVQPSVAARKRASVPYFGMTTRSHRLILLLMLFLDASPRSSKVVLAEDTTLAAISDANSYPLYVLADCERKVTGVQRGAGGEGALRRLLSKAGLRSDAI